MLPFNESCFSVLHSIMVKRKAIHKFHCTQFHSSASALLVFSVQESKKRGNFKEQPTWHLQHWAITQFETLPKHQASSGDVLPSGDGGKAKGAGGAQGKEWDGGNRQEEKGSGELWG